MVAFQYTWYFEIYTNVLCRFFLLRNKKNAHKHEIRAIINKLKK